MDYYDIASKPVFAVSERDRPCVQPGLTYREWLIGMALAGGYSGAHEDGKPNATAIADMIIVKLSQE